MKPGKIRTWRTAMQVEILDYAEDDLLQGFVFDSRQGRQARQEPRIA
jgi:hypothetical protein